MMHFFCGMLLTDYHISKFVMPYFVVSFGVMSTICPDNVHRYIVSTNLSFSLKISSFLRPSPEWPSGSSSWLVEQLHEWVALYLKKIICNWCRRVKEMQFRASGFVQEKIFNGERPPESLRRRFNPNRKEALSLITRIIFETCHSKINQ